MKNEFVHLKQRLRGYYPIGPIGDPEFGWRNFNKEAKIFTPPIQEQAAEYINILEKIILEHVDASMVSEAQYEIINNIEKEKDAPLFSHKQKD